MIGASKPPPDVDALARRLPRREPGADRSTVMRNAILEAAASAPAAVPRSFSRGWMIGGLAAAAAAACAWLVLRGADRPAPIASTTAGPTSSHSAAPSVASEAAAPALAPLPSPAGPGPARRSRWGGTGGDAALAAVVPAPLPDGVSSFVADGPLLVTRGSATITAPPDARFEVEVRDNEVRHVTVTAGWVVVASGRARTTIVPARYTWTPDAPAPQPTPPGVPPATAAPPAPRAPSNAPTAPAETAPPAALPRTAAVRPAPRASADRQAPGLPALPAPHRAAEPASERRPPALVIPPNPSEPAAPAGTGPPPPQPSAPAPPDPEQDFRDGLSTLLGGNAGAAIPLLDRACRAPSASQDDSCYWAAVAWLRSGARPHARRAFTEVLTRWPGSTHASEAHIALGWLLLEVGDPVAARSHFAAAADDKLPSIRADALRGLTATQ